MGENIADLGGLSLALKTLEKTFNKTVFTDIDEVTACNRVLFKSYANIWKEQSKVDLKINRLITDPHAPAHFRANLVNNMNEFYYAFDIKDTDKMYLPPEKRLRMW